MRFAVEDLSKRFGEIKVISKFLLFPKKLDNEWRWMESAFIIQKVIGIDVGGSAEWGRYKFLWRDMHWLDTKGFCLTVYKDMLKINKEG